MMEEEPNPMQQIQIRQDQHSRTEIIADMKQPDDKRKKTKWQTESLNSQITEFDLRKTWYILDLIDKDPATKDTFLTPPFTA